MSKKCCDVLPIVDVGRVTTLSIETTGPLLNTGFCACGSRTPCGCRRRRRR